MVAEKPEKQVTPMPGDGMGAHGLLRDPARSFLVEGGPCAVLAAERREGIAIAG